MFYFVSTAYASSDAPGAAAAYSIVGKINDAILFPLIAMMMALAFLYFLYGAFEYVKNANNEAARETGRNHLMYGVIGMLVMLSAYAILNIAAGTFGLQGELQKARENTQVTNFGSFGEGGVSRGPGIGPNSSSVLGDLPAPPIGNPISGKCYSVYDCGPSKKADPFAAMRDELVATNGLLQGGMVRMDLVQFGEVSLALEQVATYYAQGNITAQTRDRLISTISADTSRPNATPTNDTFVDTISNTLDTLDPAGKTGITETTLPSLDTNNLVDPFVENITNILNNTEVAGLTQTTINDTQKSQYALFENEMISNGISATGASDIVAALAGTSVTESTVESQLQLLVDKGFIQAGTMQQVLVDRFGI